MRTKSLLLGLTLLAPLGALLPMNAAQAVTCSSFKTQEEAQAYMQRYGAKKLDGDRDGIACERLPRGAAIAPNSGNNQSSIVTSSIVTAQVISIGDGDTLTVKDSQDKRTIVRLACIDAPEMAQKPYGEKAAQRLKQLAPVGSTVRLRVVDRDRYGRTVAEVARGSTQVNLAMVTDGQAVVYRQYLGGCTKSLQQQLVQAEQTAKQQRLGFWQQDNPVLPSVYRHTAAR
jgi:endonuclease YncB( thermonuclease family)